MDHITNEVP